MSTDGHIEFTVRVGVYYVTGSTTIATIDIGDPTVYYCNVVGQYEDNVVPHHTANITLASESTSIQEEGINIELSSGTITIYFDDPGYSYSITGIFKIEAMIATR